MATYAKSLVEMLTEESILQVRDTLSTFSQQKLLTNDDKVDELCCGAVMCGSIPC